MSLPVLDSPAAIALRVQEAIEAGLPDAQVRVVATSPGHFEIEVVSASFEGQPRLRQQQRVYAAIAPLMAGDRPPVHAVDQLRTRTP
jgi:acid stress-induced BolA-like protein IbaG/YrbA